LASKKPVSKKSEPPVPGAPGVEPPTLAEPTKPRGPLPPKADQQGPDTRTATGAPTTVSPTDVAQAPDPGWHYILVSLRDVQPVVRSYRIVDEVVTEEPVRLQPR